MFDLSNLGIVIEAPSGPYPFGRLINSNPIGSGNGSPAVAEWANDAIMGMYAALDHFGLSPSGLQEQVGNSDFVRLLQAVSPIGSFIDMGTDTDPSTLGIRVLAADGSTVSEVTYADLFVVIGTKWNTGGEPGGEFRLPDFRGKFRRGWDAGAGVDSGRVFGENHPDRFQGHLFNIDSSIGTNNMVVEPSATGPVANGNNTPGAGASSQPRYQTTAPISDGVNGTPRTGDETNPNNETAYIGIRY